MKILYRYLVLVFLFCIVSCSSYKILPEQITVVVSAEVLQSSSKLYAIDRYRADAYLENKEGPEGFNFDQFVIAT